jgi:hypothetical protein
MLISSLRAVLWSRTSARKAGVGERRVVGRAVVRTDSRRSDPDVPGLYVRRLGAGSATGLRRGEEGVEA